MSQESKFDKGVDKAVGITNDFMGSTWKSIKEFTSSSKYLSAIFIVASAVCYFLFVESMYLVYEVYDATPEFAKSTGWENVLAWMNRTDPDYPDYFWIGIVCLIFGEVFRRLYKG